MLKKIMILILGLGLAAGTASATVELSDAQWATARGFFGSAGATFDGALDITGDPGYEFTNTVVNASEFMVFGVATGGIATNAWTVRIKNPTATPISARLAIYHSDGLGGGWVFEQLGVLQPFSPGEEITMTADLSSYASIERLAILYWGQVAGTGVLQVIPAPAPLTELVLYDADWLTFGPGGGISGTVDSFVDITNNPGMEIQMTFDPADSGTLIGLVSMGSTTLYDGLPWRVEVLNTNVFTVNVKQVTWSDGWANFDQSNPDTVLAPGASALLTKTLPPGETLEGVGFILSTAESLPVGVNIQIIGPQAPDLTPLELYTLWTEDYPSLTDTNLAVDFEMDGMDNLLEYALGGDPTDDDATIKMPVSSIIESGGTNYVEYIYTRRLDAVARGLAYDISFKFNLVTDPWTPTVGGFETGTSTIDADFESVTNEIPITFSDEAFITLEVTETF